MLTVIPIENLVDVDDDDLEEDGENAGEWEEEEALAEQLGFEQDYHTSNRLAFGSQAVKELERNQRKAMVEVYCVCIFVFIFEGST